MEVASDLIKIFVSFLHINYSFYKVFRCSGKSPASSGIGKYCSVLWWRIGIIIFFFQIGIVDGFCILKSFVMMSIRTTSQNRKNVNQKIHSSPNVTFTTHSELPITRTFGIFFYFSSRLAEGFGEISQFQLSFKG